MVNTTSTPTEEPKIHILVLAANPKGTLKLDLDTEAGKIKKVLNACQNSQRFTLETYWAVTAEDLQFALAKEKPQLVHFIGHGGGDNGLVFESDIEKHIITENDYRIDNRQFIKSKALANLFALVSRYVQCVVLNACYSEAQAMAICQSINYVIGTKNAIGDRVATKFAAGFYTWLGNDPRGIDVAYQAGLNAVELVGLDPSPFVLKKKVNPLRMSCLNSSTTSVNCLPAIAPSTLPD